MSVLKKLRENLFLVLVVLAYGLMLILKPSMGLEAVKSSGYYIREMLLIMPVIFVLTALLDLWVPKEKILKYLGRGAGLKGLVLSFVVGSISAGPVYAAFPMCAMLHKKGASIRNVVIILSSWAVIKVPMLLSESRFLGPSFMALRWVLTVIAILIFSWITAKLVKDRDLPGEAAARTGLQVSRDACIGCGLCARNHPGVFEMDGKKARVKSREALACGELAQLMEACPVKAITYEEAPCPEL